MNSNELSMINSLKEIARLSSKHSFQLVEADKLYQLKPIGNIHKTTYHFTEYASIRDISNFLKGYDAACEQIERNNSLHSSNGR